MTHILVTNDDGIDSLGIHKLANALIDLKKYDVTIVAPSRERSATSHSLTLHRPLRVNQINAYTYTVDGTPTDCVMLGVNRLLKSRPDWIVSGINRGGNLGDDVHYSGTVSAAIEGGIMGIPAIAFSQLGEEPFDYEMAVLAVQKLVPKVIDEGLPSGIVLNVNIPEKCESLDFEVVGTGKRNYGDMHFERLDPRGKPYYWVGGNIYDFQDIPDTDCNAIQANKISVTPLQVNMTSRSFLEVMKEWKWR